MATDTSVPFWWVLVFVALALGAGAAAILFVGGDLLGSSGFLLPG